MIAFFQGAFVVLVSFVTGVSLDNALDLVNLAWKPSGRDQFWQLPINEINRDPKLIGHGLEPDSFVGLQELRVDNNSGFPDEIPGVQMNVLVLFDIVDDPEEVGEELLIPAVVKALNVALDLWQLHQVHYNLTGLKDFLLDGLSVHTDDTGDDCIGD